jgi:hypothetical protein
MLPRRRCSRPWTTARSDSSLPTYRVTSEYRPLASDASRSRSQISLRRTTLTTPATQPQRALQLPRARRLSPEDPWRRPARMKSETSQIMARSTAKGMLVAEFSLSLRVKMTLGVGNFFLGLLLKLYHNAIPSRGLGIHIYRLLASQGYASC